MTGFDTLSLHAGQHPDPWRFGEPGLSDVMTDPLVHLVMRRDGLDPADVWPLLHHARQWPPEPAGETGA